MAVVDVIIAIIVLGQAVYWGRIGLLAGSFSIGGFVFGMFMAGIAGAPAVGLIDDPGLRLLAALCLLAAAGGIGGAAGRIVGEFLASTVRRIRLAPLDATLGAALGADITLVAIWLLFSVIGATPLAFLAPTLRGSHILRYMDMSLPPAPVVIARMVDLIDTDRYPQVFVGLGPGPVEPVDMPADALVAAALAAAGNATVRIEGIGCGGFANGSGFIAAAEMVVTNAHVVAGADRIGAVSIRGYHSARVVHFDKDLDIAVLHVAGLEGAPLPLAETPAERGSSGTVLGYPNGGRLTAVGAGVMRRITAKGRDIYGAQISVRPVYELQTTVSEGNSGGPFVRPDGTVLGVLFAESVHESGRAYAITVDNVRPVIRTLSPQSATTANGRCI